MADGNGVRRSGVGLVERYVTALYLSSGTIARTCMGYATCRVCGRANGSMELSDGIYIWPEGLAHYLEAHDVRLPTAVVGHAIARMDALESAAIDESWWRDEMTAP